MTLWVVLEKLLVSQTYLCQNPAFIKGVFDPHFIHELCRLYNIL